ncbi:MAG: hypothetical protein RBT80_27040 [Candidatus Vecturithrix sp.]|jgi:acetyl-CoA acetyltransferase|nr:hypothetical protein [Candidatus Vecturithrix sp.]
MQDAWALRSQQKYQEALKQGKLKDEMMVLELQGGKKVSFISTKMNSQKAIRQWKVFPILKPFTTAQL